MDQITNNTILLEDKIKFTDEVSTRKNTYLSDKNTNPEENSVKRDFIYEFIKTSK